VSLRVLVVGGGIAGLTAALGSAKRGQQVLLIEKQERLGGLLASWRDEETGCWFDRGTHIPASTGDATLDEILFGWMAEEEWQKLSCVKAGTFWNGRMQSESPCLDLRSLDPNSFVRVIEEITDRGRPMHGGLGCANLRQELDADYGPFTRERVFDPALKKFYGTGSENLAPGAHRLFGMMRFIGPDADTTRELKLDPNLDGRLAHHNGRAVSDLRSFYPKRGGCGRWVDRLECMAREQGTHIQTGLSVDLIDPEARVALLADGTSWAFDRLIWTLPAGLLLRAAGLSLPGGGSAPKFSRVRLHHFKCKGRLQTDAHYITCYDPDFHAFRATLYDNLQPGESDGSPRITVEVLVPPTEGECLEGAGIISELIRMGIVSKDTRPLRCLVQDLARGFPVQTPDFIHSVNQQARRVEQDLPFAVLAGRGSGGCFFMKDALLEVWRIAQTGESHTKAA